ncbi:tetratricopeptide (TPR) repeat protein [Kitasatospora kifunensis]|uniref:Tetratricopeptide (TPR) repeat protein n=2 Tax=Kitasatospora kifunensis TaxID=58351 RepID=A0A7W7VZR9_KITKI|nr:tetratricopeptide (TPR) repeat protein [Kitasatospora kifunensis]
MTQDAFASLLERSVRWVEDLEGGRRQSDPRLSVLEAIARVLQIPLEALLADPPTAQCTDAVELALIRAALQHHDVITGTAGTAPPAPLPVGVLRAQLVHARTAFQAGRFGMVSRTVPELLVAANASAAQLTGDDQLTAYQLLALTLELAEAAAIKAGDTDLATIAGHRAVAAAERSEDPIIMASSARHLADAMTGHGQPQAAVAFALASAARLAPVLLARGGTAVSTSVLGMLYLKASLAQAAVAESLGEDSAAAAVFDFLNEADGHASRLDRSDGNELWTAFNATNCALYRVAAHVQLFDGAAAVAVAAEIPPTATAALPRERRAHLWGDLARAYTQAGRYEEAVTTLLRAEDEAPEEVRCRPRTRLLVEDLRLLANGAGQGRLRALAGRCGLPQ